MILDKHRSAVRERTLLVGLETPKVEHWQIVESLAELASLVKTAGGEVSQTVTQRLPHPTAPFYIGKGKAEELHSLCNEQKLESVVFDDELSPAQNRNLARVFDRKVVDRTQLILDIFAQRAKTREGKLQIELAQLQYLLPRLTRMWTHLSRQSGGIGTRGPGETQLEVDRRRVQEKIAKLGRDLDEVRRHRETQRLGRTRHNWPLLSIVGYTNAGKSTLFNRLTSATVLAEDKLFATLDPTTRLVELPGKQKALLTDTVGFIRKLPHDLIESFKATLEEVRQADLLLHVIDLSHSLYEQQIASVMEVLAELDAAEKPMLLIFNKVDQVESPGMVARVLAEHPCSVAVSAQTGEGLEELLHLVHQKLLSRQQRLHLRIPNHRTEVIALLHREGQVIALEYLENQILVEALLPPSLVGKLREYIVSDHGLSPDSRDARRGETSRASSALGPGEPEKLGASGDSSPDRIKGEVGVAVG